MADTDTDILLTAKWKPLSLLFSRRKITKDMLLESEAIVLYQWSNFLPKNSQDCTILEPYHSKKLNMHFRAYKRSFNKCPQVYANIQSSQLLKVHS